MTTKAKAPPPVPAPAPRPEAPDVRGSLNVSEIRPSPTNPRKTFDAEVERELEASVLELGVLENLVVRPRGKSGAPVAFRDGGYPDADYFECVAGERRLRAARAVALPSVPVLIRDLTDEEVLLIQLAENDQREDVPPSEQAAAYGRLAKAGNTAEQIAVKTGKPVRFVRGLLTLARLPAWALAAVDVGSLPRSVAELLARVPGEKSRELAAACAVFGQRWPGTVEPKHLKELAKKGPPIDVDALTYRQTEELIARHFQVELKSAPFSRKALDLVEGAGSCEECPKRAGNDADAKAAGTRADVCLDPECYRAKEAAHNKQQLAVAKSTGLTVLPAKEAEKLFPHGSSLTYDSGYVDLEETCYEAKGKKYKTLLEKHVEPAQVVVAVDKSGTPHKLVKKDVAAKVLRDEHKIGAKSNTVGADDSYKREERKRREKAELGRLAQAAACERVVEVMAKSFAPLDAYAFAGAVALLRQVAAEVSNFAGADVCRVIVKRRGLEKAKFDDRGTVAKLAAGMNDPRELIALIAECAAARVSWGWGASYNSGSMDKGEVAFWKTFGVDRAALLKAAGEGKAQPKGKKAAKPVKTQTKPATVEKRHGGIVGFYGKDQPADKKKPGGGKPTKAETKPIKPETNGKSIHKPGCTFEADLAKKAAAVVPPNVLPTPLAKPLSAIAGFPAPLAAALEVIHIRSDIALCEYVEKEKGSHREKLAKVLGKAPGTYAEEIEKGVAAMLDYLYPGRKKKAEPAATPKPARTKKTAEEELQDLGLLSKPGVVLLSEVENLPEAVFDVLFHAGVSSLPTFVERANENDPAGLPPRNKFVLYLVKLGVKLRQAELAADAIASCLESTEPAEKETVS